MSTHEISKTEFDSKVILYLDPGSRPINQEYTQRWFSLPAFVDEDSKQIIVPGSISTLYRARIVITDDRTVRKFGKALNLNGKKLLPPTYDDLISKCVHVEEGFNEFVNTENWIKTSSFKYLVPPIILKTPIRLVDPIVNQKSLPVTLNV